MLRIALLATTLIATAPDSCAQPLRDAAPPSHWRDAVVDIHSAGGKAGSGFIVAEADGLRYIITAAHVVGDAAEVEVRMTSEQAHLSANVLHYNRHYDVAILSIPANLKAPWQAYPYAADGRVGEPVFMWSGRAGKREEVSRNGTAKIGAVDGEDLESNVGVAATDSGTPIFTARGVVGLALTDPGNGRSAALVKELVEDWGVPWQLPAAPALPEAAEPEAPKPKPAVSRRRLDVAAVWIYGQSQVPLSGAFDGNLATAAEVTADGLLVIRLRKFSAFDRLRVYRPDSYTGDFPTGVFLLEGKKRRIRVAAAKSPVMQREGTGTWMIFDFGGIVHGSEISLRYRLERRTDKPPVPYRFFEISVEGPVNL